MFSNVGQIFIHTDFLDGGYNLPNENFITVVVTLKNTCNTEIFPYFNVLGHPTVFNSFDALIILHVANEYLRQKVEVFLILWLMKFFLFLLTSLQTTVYPSQRITAKLIYNTLAVKNNKITGYY